MDHISTLLAKSSCGGKKILLGCTGSVATIKVPEIVAALQNNGHTVVVIPTNSALHFLTAQARADKHAKNMQSNISNNSYAGGDVSSKTLLNNSNQDNEVISHFEGFPNSRNLMMKCGCGEHLNNSQCDKCDSTSMNSDVCSLCEVKGMYPTMRIVSDKDEWTAWQKRGDPVLHIKLCHWADLLLIAPLDANTLAKIAQGLCDNLLTCIVRAWNIKYPLLFCPAMNTQMYSHPLTSQHTTILKELGYKEIDAVTKLLACGDVGFGAMAEVATIVSIVSDLPLDEVNVEKE